MDELIKQGQWWWPFFVPVAAGVFALFGSWIGTKLGKDTEHAQWLRNQKQGAFIDFLDSCRVLDQWSRSAQLTPQEERIKEMRELIANIKVTPVRLMAPKPSVEASNHMLDSLQKLAIRAATKGGSMRDPEFRELWDQYIEARTALGDLYRKDIGAMD